VAKIHLCNVVCKIKVKIDIKVVISGTAIWTRYDTEMEMQATRILTLKSSHSSARGKNCKIMTVVKEIELSNIQVQIIPASSNNSMIVCIKDQINLIFSVIPV